MIKPCSPHIKNIYIQAVTAGILTILIQLCSNKHNAFSFFLGTIVYLLPLLVFSSYYFRKSTKVTPRYIVKSLYVGLIYKAGISIGILMLIFSCFKINGMMFFSGLVVMQLLSFMQIFIRREQE